jgi:DNA topoisomerase-2
MATPIVKVKKGRAEHLYNNHTVRGVEGGSWPESGWSVKYYRLGTSTTAEAKEYFKQMKSTDFVTDDKSTDAMDLAFNKKRADDRKSWLKQYDRTKVLRDDRPQLTHRDFVDYELIHFSNYDLERSLPSAIDGLKVCSARSSSDASNASSPPKFVSLSWRDTFRRPSSTTTAKSVLQGAIVGLAQDYVGSNNINLLRPNGQFGTRIQGVEGLCVGQVHPYRTISCHYENFPS